MLIGKYSPIIGGNFIKPIQFASVFRLCGPRGILAIDSSFHQVKLKGKGHEKADVALVLKSLEHWAHRTYFHGQIHF